MLLIYTSKVVNRTSMSNTKSSSSSSTFVVVVDRKKNTLIVFMTIENNGFTLGRNFSKNIAHRTVFALCNHLSTSFSYSNIKPIKYLGRETH